MPIWGLATLAKGAATVGKAAAGAGKAVGGVAKAAGGLVKEAAVEVAQDAAAAVKNPKAAAKDFLKGELKDQLLGGGQRFDSAREDMVGNRRVSQAEEDQRRMRGF